MKLQLLALAMRLRGSYWFIPGCLALLAAVLAVLMAGVDAYAREHMPVPVYPFPSIDAASARTILSTIAGSAITVAGVVFSITIVVLSTTISHFGPRLLPNFMKHNGTQIVLGGFIGTFIYCLITLFRVSEAGMIHASQYSVSLGMLLGIVSFGLLIYYIHHVAMFIQVPRVLHDVEVDLRQTLTEIFPGPGPGGDEHPGFELPDDFDRECRTITARRAGYLQAVDYELLLNCAQEHDLLMRVPIRAGFFLLQREPILFVYPGASIDEEKSASLHEAFLVGEARTSLQDPEFAVDQMVEIALRALSPSVNDPFTAINCIDRLGAALALLADRRQPSAVHLDSHGKPRLLTAHYSYTGVLDRVFNQLRQNARNNPAVAIRLLEVMTSLAARNPPQDYRTSLDMHARLVYEAAICDPCQAYDRADLDERYARFRSLCAVPEYTD